MSGAELALASFVMAVGALVQGSIGFGLNLIAAPVLALIDRELVPGPALVAAFVLTLLITGRERRSVDVRGVGWAITGRIPGTLLAAVAIAALPERAMGVTFAVLVLLGVALTATRWQLQPTTRTLLGAGALSGFMGTTTSIGGPPMALVYQQHPGPTIRATLSGYFVIGSIISIATLVAIGEFSWDQLGASAALVPGLLIGFAASKRTTRVVDDRGAARAAVLWLSALAAVAVLFDQVV